MREARDSGRYKLTRIEGSVHRTPHEGVMMALMTRVRKVDATDAEQLSAAEREGRRQAHEYFRFLRDCVPGYERASLLSTSPAIGVRESRRIVGEHVLTSDEILAATQFDDQIAHCGAPIEEHHAGDDTRWVYLEEGATYGIPFRSLQPRGLDNVLVAGRCFSATHDAHASARSMGTCMAMGQAAGTAAALSVEPKRLAADVLRGTAARGRRRCRRLIASAKSGSSRCSGASTSSTPRSRDSPRRGFGLIEITLDSDGALEAIRRHPGALAGTVRTAAQVDAAVEAGAVAVVSPVFVPAVLERARELGVPAIPGALTPTEVEAAWRAGAALVKLFPAALGGPRYVRDLLAPLSDVPLIVTGGVDASNARAFLDAGAVAVGTSRVDEALELVAAVRRS